MEETKVGLTSDITSSGWCSVTLLIEVPGSYRHAFENIDILMGL